MENKLVLLLERRRIIDVIEKEKGCGRSLILKLDNGRNLEFCLEDSIGANGAYYIFASLRLGNKKIWDDLNGSIDL